MKILSLLIVFSLSISIAGAADLTPASEQLIDDLKVNIQNTLIAIGENEKRAGKRPEDVYFFLNLPAQQLTNLGIVLDVDNPTTGYSVLAVSPGSEAEALGIAVGSKIVQINDIVISQSSAENALQQLQDLTAGEKVTLVIENNNMTKKIETNLNGQYVPEVRLEVGSYAEADRSLLSAYSNEISEEMENACGRISVFFRPPEARDLFPAFVNKIDDKNVISSRNTFRLPPGKHVIKIHELIIDPFLMGRRHTRQKSKTIEIDVKPNFTYHLAAKFLREYATKTIREEGFWEPVVWKVSQDKCELQ